MSLQNKSKMRRCVPHQPPQAVSCKGVALDPLRRCPRPQRAKCERNGSHVCSARSYVTQPQVGAMRGSTERESLLQSRACS